MRKTAATKRVKSTVSKKVEAKLNKIMAAAAEQAELGELELLDNPNYVNLVLGDRDSEILDAIIAKLEEASDGTPLFTGYTFDDNTEKLVAIVNKLQFAPRDIRAAIPREYYSIFDRATRDMVIKAYGRLPYFKEATQLTLADGSIKVLDPESTERNMKGVKPDIETLELGCKVLASKLRLVGKLDISKQRIDEAWSRAETKAETEYTLYQLKEQLKTA